MTTSALESFVTGTWDFGAFTRVYDTKNGTQQDPSIDYNYGVVDLTDLYNFNVVSGNVFVEK